MLKEKNIIHLFSKLLFQSDVNSRPALYGPNSKDGGCAVEHNSHLSGTELQFAGKGTNDRE